MVDGGVLSTLAGERCDLMVTTETMSDELVARGHLRDEGRVELGRVRAGVAVRAGTTAPDVSATAALAAAVRAADAIYVPGTVRSTAGAHVAKVLDALDLRELLAGRLREYPNGGTAMAEPAASPEAAARFTAMPGDDDGAALRARACLEPR